MENITMSTNIYMRLIAVLFITSLHAQGFGFDIGIGGHFPQGEFKDQEVPQSFALDLNGYYYFNGHAAIGLNLGGSQYGFSERDIPFNQWTSVGLIEQTRNNTFHGNLLLRIIPFKGPVQIYGEALGGFRNLYTETKLFSNSNNCDDPDTDIDECEIASETNATDTAFGYGLGGGIEVGIASFVDEETQSSSKITLFIEGSYLWGGEIQYLKEGGITVTPDPNGVAFPNVTYDWNESRTDIFQVMVGIGIKFGLPNNKE